MYKKAEQTAVLIFSRTAASEAQVKTFDSPSGKAGNTLIARYLIRRTIRTARSSGLPVFLHYDTFLPNKTFGERLADAMESVFEKGFSSVITIGNDSPELTGEMLRYTSHQLADDQSVLGPAVDGGVYLIGLTRDNYSRESFVALPWQTCQLQQAWRNSYFSITVGPDWLEELHDIDHSKDFQLLLRRLRNDVPLLKSLLSILASYRNQSLVFPFSIPILTGFGTYCPLRGPPAVI